MNMKFRSITGVHGSTGPPSTISVLPDAQAGSLHFARNVMLLSLIDLPSNQ